MKPNLNQNSQDSLNLAHVDTTLVTTRDSLGLASENMVFSPRIPLSGQIPLSKSGSTDSGASDVLRNLLSKYDDVVSKIENLSTIYEEMYRSTSTTSDVSTTVLESPSFIVDRTADNPLEATVNENLDTYMDLKGQSNPLELSTILCEDVLLCDKSEISVYSNPILDLTPVILDSEKAKSTLSQEIDNLDTYDEPDGFSDSSERRRLFQKNFHPVVILKSHGSLSPPLILLQLFSMMSLRRIYQHLVYHHQRNCQKLKLKLKTFLSQSPQREYSLMQGMLLQK